MARPSAGNVRLRGMDPIRSHAKALEGVGYSAELPNIQSFMTPDQVLELAAAEVGLGSPGQEIRRVLEEVGIVEYRDVKVGKLSKGMVQRLSVAQAMLGSPEIMVMDEPMIGLDPAGTAHLRESFREYARNGGTILMSSHMMSEVEDLCSSVGLIHSGRLLFHGTVREMVGQTLGAELVHVEARGLTRGVVDSLRKIEGVLDVEETGEGLEIRASQGVEIRPEVSRIIATSGAELLTIGRGTRMLERAYIEALKIGDSQAE